MAITAKQALSRLKGNLTLVNARIIENNRAGVDSSAAQWEKEAIEYSIAAVSAFKAAGKSAFKSLERVKSGGKL